MRILAIRGQNLASLSRSFEVELAHGPLAGVGLFAITGPVGAGKSTLLDALCLPLFDRTPRLSGRGGALVGDDGDPGDWLRANDPRTLLRRDAAAGFAEVDFVGRDGVRYRARWAVRRARRRADGRMQEQELQLTDLDRGVVVASGRRTEVLAAIQLRLGLDFAQFCRSVLLAQGDFAAFLRASADERARLLETLTGADVYRRLSQAAHERARAHARTVEALRAQFATQAPLAAEARAALEQEATRLADQVQVAEVARQLASRYVTWHEAAEHHRRRESEATVALQRAVAAAAAAGDRRRQLEARQRAVQALPRWEVAAEAEQAAARAAGVAQARRADAERARAAAAGAQQRFAAAFAAAFGGPLPAEPPPLLRDLPQWAGLLAACGDAEKRATALAVPAAAGGGASGDAPDLDTVAARRRELQQELAAASVRQQRLEAWQQAEAAAAAAAQALAARGEAAAAAAVAAQHRAAERALAVAAAGAARTELDGARGHAGLAAFRERLQAGEPCPLCGAREHPAPVAPATADLRALERRCAAAERAAAAAERVAAEAGAVAAAAQRERELAAQQHLSTVRARDAAAAAFAAAAPSPGAGALEAAAAAVATRRQQLVAAEQALQADEARAARAAQQAEAQRARCEAERLAAALEPACVGLGHAAAALAARGDLAARLPALHRLWHDGEAAAAAAAAAGLAADQAERERQQAALGAGQAQQALAHALQVAGVAAADVAAAAQLGAEALAAEAAALQQLAEDVVRQRAIVQERAGERQRHERSDRPSLAAGDARAALDEARASQDAASERLAGVRTDLGVDDVIRRQRAELQPRIDAAERELATWRALDELIGSSSGDTFAVFAQELTLDLLLLEANRRLAELARRYRLQKNPGGALDFVVVDRDLGGTRRSVQTLSGGETFLVSLALALALATLAAPRSRVETLFLDEGFGTLDAPSLEQALGALDALQATGCQVGIISHVDGIADRIGAQVVVQPEGGGKSRVFALVR